MCGGCPADLHHCDFKSRVVIEMIDTGSGWLWIVSGAAFVLASFFLCFAGYRRYGSAMRN
jgi:hypothetical protein